MFIIIKESVKADGVELHVKNLCISGLPRIIKVRIKD